MTPWADMLRYAVTMGIMPEAFWRLSLKEWRAVIAPPQSPNLGRQGLEALIARFPDVTTAKGSS